MTWLVSDRGCIVARGGRKPRFALGQPLYDRPMLSLLYLVVRALVRLLVSAGRAGRVDGSKDLEILVLRHQLRVLHRTARLGPAPRRSGPTWTSVPPDSSARDHRRRLLHRRDRLAPDALCPRVHRALRAGGST